MRGVDLKLAPLKGGGVGGECNYYTSAISATLRGSRKYSTKSIVLEPADCLYQPPKDIQTPPPELSRGVERR